MFSKCRKRLPQQLLTLLRTISGIVLFCKRFLIAIPNTRVGNDPFFKKLKFQEVLECTDLIYPGAVVQHSYAASFRLRRKIDNGAVLYELDSFTKYSIAVNPTDDHLYAKNPQFGWQRCLMATARQLPPSKVVEAKRNKGKEILLTICGNCKSTVDHVNVDSDVSMLIPEKYRQDSYTVQNSCVWLGACLVIRYIDNVLADKLLRLYQENTAKFDWLYLFNRGYSDNRTLFNYM